MTTLTAEPDDQVPALAAVLMRTLGLEPAQAVQVAAALSANGVRVDVAEQADFAWAQQMAAYWDANPEPRLSVADINAAAAVERTNRLKALVQHSAGQLVPNAADHAMIDRLLEEIV